MIAYADTSLGRLIAATASDDEYPGITIFLERGNRVLQLAAIEEDKGELKLRAYPNAEDDEPSIMASFEQLDHALDMLGYDRTKGEKNLDL